MRKLTRLWKTLERIPGLCDISAYWEHHCGVDYPLLRPHLRVTDDFGARYPCPHPQDGHCPRSIVDYGDGSFAAICRHPHKLCEDRPLPSKDALVYRLDVDAMLRPIAELLCVRSQTLRVRGGGVWELGLSTSRTTRNQPAFLLVFAGGDDFRSAVRDLALSCPTPFVAVAPTGNHLTVDLREQLDRRQSDFISMEDRVGMSEDGRFVALEITDADEIAPTPVEQRPAGVNQYKQDFEYTVDNICSDANVNRSDFYKWMKGKLDSKSGKSIRIEEALRTNPKLRHHR
jgi:hypothetical protein